MGMWNDMAGRGGVEKGDLDILLDPVIEARQRG
jgi:hypothetical protein